MKEVWIPGLNLHRFWRFYSLISSIFNDQFEKLHVYQTFKSVFDQVLEHLDLGFNSLLGVWIS